MQVQNFRSPHDAEEFIELLRTASGQERADMLLDAYRQLSRQSEGPIRDFVETDSSAGYDFAHELIEQLRSDGHWDEADKLVELYTSVPEAPRKSWTEGPNIFDQKTVDKLIERGDSGTRMAAFGAVIAALETHHRAEIGTAPTQFFYPTSRQFPFDEVTEKLVKALEQRNFNVPGIKVGLETYGPSKAYWYVSTIEGPDFRLWFCREQRGLGEFSDIAAVTELNIPGMELHVYHDNSGPTLYLYVGENWERDKEAFVHGNKVNSKLNNEPRMYLMYHGSWQRDGRGVSYRGRVPPFLAHYDDLGREYDPQNGEPTYFETGKIFEQFRRFLQKKLGQIKLGPLAFQILDD